VAPTTAIPLGSKKKSISKEPKQRDSSNLKKYQVKVRVRMPVWSSGKGKGLIFNPNLSTFNQTGFIALTYSLYQKPKTF